MWLHWERTFTSFPLTQPPIPFPFGGFTFAEIDLGCVFGVAKLRSSLEYWPLTGVGIFRAGSRDVGTLTDYADLRQALWCRIILHTLSQVHPLFQKAYTWTNEMKLRKLLPPALSGPLDVFWCILSSGSYHFYSSCPLWVSLIVLLWHIFGCLWEMKTDDRDQFHLQYKKCETSGLFAIPLPAPVTLFLPVFTPHANETSLPVLVMSCSWVGTDVWL